MVEILIFTHKQNQLLAQKKKKIPPYDFKPCNRKYVAQKEFWHLTPSKWPSSQNMGKACALAFDQ
jgi:hypothetical protein